MELAFVTTANDLAGIATAPRLFVLPYPGAKLGGCWADADRRRSGKLGGF
jgi:hypothetical protein